MLCAPPSRQALRKVRAVAAVRSNAAALPDKSMALGAPLVGRAAAAAAGPMVSATELLVTVAVSSTPTSSLQTLRNSVNRKED